MKIEVNFEPSQTFRRVRCAETSWHLHEGHLEPRVEESVFKYGCNLMQTYNYLDAKGQRTEVSPGATGHTLPFNASGELL